MKIQREISGWETNPKPSEYYSRLEKGVYQNGYRASGRYETPWMFEDIHYKFVKSKKHNITCYVGHGSRMEPDQKWASSSWTFIRNEEGVWKEPDTCCMCGGYGFINKEQCPHCEGEGWQDYDVKDDYIEILEGLLDLVGVE